MEEHKLTRCWKTENPLYIKYHDEEWGTPVHDDRILFEFLVLEGFQAGLTWELILRRREALKKSFDGFDPEKISNYTDEDVERVMNSPGMIRNSVKIRSVINNAKKFKEIRNEFGSFEAYIWRFVGGRTIDHGLRDFSGMPPESEESKAMSSDLKRHGFTFVGPTICYAFMQAVGMVNDHLIGCFRYKCIRQLSEAEK